MDFFQIRVKERTEKQGGGLTAFPDFIVGRSEDLMVRAKNFYAIWDEEKGLWSTDEYDVQRLVDAKLNSYRKENKDVVEVKLMRNFSSNGQSTFRKYMSQIGENSHQLDETLTFQSTEVTKKDYASKRLPYDLAPGDISAWNELVSTLYSPEERAKIEWAFGSIVSGDSKKIQKFLVLEGPPGAGKGTIINIAMMLFDGYHTTFDAKALGTSGAQFASAAFASNPLLAIQHDGDLSRIEDNTTLNSITSHEIMKVNEKYKPSYDTRINAFLIMGTNKPVRITDSQSGLIRRLIDCHPTGNLIPPKKYHALLERIKFELGAIAHHCLQVYKEMGKNYYSSYRPLEMMYKTNAFFNFIEAHYDLFEKQGGTSAKQAWQLYKDYCEEANIDRPMKLHEFRAELGTYFEEFHDRIVIDNTPVRSWYAKLKTQAFKMPVDDDVTTFMLRLDETISLLNLELADYPAQYAKADGSPSKYWDDSERLIGGELKRPKPHQVVDTYLKDLDPYKAHYVKVPENMIVVDFDLKDADGRKSLERNLEAASEWPPTYGELSRSGQGVHLHYYYDGDPEQLDPAYSDGIEIKRYVGHSALRRRLTLCNSVPISHISSGLPLKEKTRVLDPGTMKSEKALRELIARNLRKEIHPGTKPSIDFIKHILDEAHESGMSFDVSDLYPKVIAFANNSSNKSLECLKIVQTMRWKSEEDISEEPVEVSEERLVFFDCEVYPNLFVVCWKFEEDNPSIDSVTKLINPKPHEIEALIYRLKLVGFNVRNYDNHILWGAALGFNNKQLYELSVKIINGVVGAKFGEAFKLSYTDIYDYSTKKQGLKKWQIELGLPHREMDLPWDQPVPDDRIMDVADYCANDVVSEEFVHKHLRGDWRARQILADLSGLTPNDTTAKHTAAIVFGREKNPQRNFVYTDLSKEFPGYVFDPMAKSDKSIYRGEAVGEGGYVYAEPGIYQRVGLLDVASMHPTSIGQLNLFGEYTPNYMSLVEAQLAIKHGNYTAAKGMLDGKLTPYLEEVEDLAEKDSAAAGKAAAELRHGLKIAMNIVYGLTSAKFDNPFKDMRNLDNIVAKRGALFMVDLKNFIQEQGFQVIHIKTDSVKIPDSTQEIIEAVQNFAAKYGYTMEFDPEKDWYDRLALVNDAVYVARTLVPTTSSKTTDPPFVPKWTAVGAQYQHPYVFKKLFDRDEPITFDDMCETKHVQQGALHLDFGLHDSSTSFGAHHSDLGYIDVALDEMKVFKKQGATDEELANIYAEAIGKLVHVGKTGRFTPVKEGYGGGLLWRVKEGKAYAVQGTKGYFWVDSVIGRDLPPEAIDYDYFETLVTEARENLAQFLEGSGFETVDDFLDIPQPSLEVYEEVKAEFERRGEW